MGNFPGVPNTRPTQRDLRAAPSEILVPKALLAANELWGAGNLTLRTQCEPRGFSFPGHCPVPLPIVLTPI